MERFRTTPRTSCSVKMDGDLQRDRRQSWWKIWSPVLSARWSSSVLVMIPQLSFRMTSWDPQIPWRSAAWCVFVVFCRTTEKRSIKEFNKKSRCQKCMFTCCCCFCVHVFLCCGMFNECMVTCYLALVHCLGSLWGWCTDRFRGR